MKLKNSDIVTLIGNAALGIRGALSDLHGMLKPMRDKDGNVLISRDGEFLQEIVPYKFAVSTRARLAVLSVTLQPYATAFETTRTDLLKEHLSRATLETGAEVTKLAPGDKRYDRFMQETNELLNTVIDVPLAPSISIDDLRPDDNNLPVDLLARLMPVLLTLP